MAAKERRKGQVAERRFAELLRSRDWTVDRTTVGVETDDGVAVDPEGLRWSLEVKDHKLLNFESFLKQAYRQATRRKARWLLACHIPTTSSWLVMRQGHRPALWHEGMGDP